MRARVKICGITSLEDARAAVDAGADALGFVFSRSPRQVSPNEVRKIVSALPPFVATVGVFVDEPIEFLLQAIETSGISMVQLQGSETNEYCKKIGRPIIKGFKIGNNVPVEAVNAFEVEAFLFDTYIHGQDGGTGKTFDWAILANLMFLRPFIVAGGLNSQNVANLIGAIQPAGVDVSSGVSANATRKDPDKMRRFVQAVTAAGKSQTKPVQQRGFDILQDAFHQRPLVGINGKQFLINPLTEQVPATEAELLRVAAERVCEALDLQPGLKLVGEEDKGGVLLAAVSLKSGLPFGIARWYPSGLAGQVQVNFDCEYTSGGLYLNGVEPGDRVIIVDDLISTGGTLIGLIEAVRRAGAIVEQIVCVAEKQNYAGVDRVRNATGLDVKTLVRIDVTGERSNVVSVAYQLGDE